MNVCLPRSFVAPRRGSAGPKDRFEMRDVLPRANLAVY